MNKALCHVAALTFALGVPSSPVLAAAPIANGDAIRVASGSIEAGWHAGRAVLDARRCWMVKLDKPTKDGYTMLALSFVKSVEASRGGGWVALPLQAIVKAQPAECLEEGSD